MLSMCVSLNVYKNSNQYIISYISSKYIIGLFLSLYYLLYLLIIISFTYHLIMYYSTILITNNK